VITPGNESRDLSAETVARVVTLLAEMGRVAQAALKAPEANAAREAVLDPVVTLEVTGVHFRPGRTGEPQRVEVGCLQRGPMPATPFVLWFTLQPGEANPYEAGLRVDVLLRPRHD
jgi:hypothetical protein